MKSRRLFSPKAMERLEVDVSRNSKTVSIERMKACMMYDHINKLVVEIRVGIEMCLMSLYGLGLFDNDV